MKNTFYVIMGSLTIGLFGLLLYSLILFTDLLYNKLGLGAAIFFLFFILGFFAIITQWDSFEEEIIDKK